MEAEAEFLEDAQVENKLNVQDYTDKSFVVTGELTRTYKDHLKALGGKFNKNLKVGPGYIFSKSKQEKVMEFVLSVNSNDVQTTMPGTTGGEGLPTVVAPPNTSSSPYQYVRFKIYRPKENQKVKLNLGGKTMEGTVVKTESHNDTIDTAYVEFDGKTSLGVICRGKWTIFGLFEPHTIYFTD